MKVLLHYPDWKNRWEPYVMDALRDFDVTVTHEINSHKLGGLSDANDVLISMWASDVVNFWSHEFPGKKIITYLRRFELWEPNYMTNPDWGAVDCVIFVSQWGQQAANMMWRQGNIEPPSVQCVIPNGVDFDAFPLMRSSKPGTGKIALVCSMKEVKNVPLAYQIMMELPDSYTLHHIGLPYSSSNVGQLFSYMHGLGLTDRFHTDWHIPSERVIGWLADKDFILSTSVNEGNPNNLIEAMAVGVKPVIHNWPGARDQFPQDLVFDRISGAVDIITGASYDPRSYRNWAVSRYGLGNFQKLTETVKEVIQNGKSNRCRSRAA